jgi:hypothetical protein
MRTEDMNSHDALSSRSIELKLYGHCIYPSAAFHMAEDHFAPPCSSRSSLIRYYADRSRLEQLTQSHRTIVVDAGTPA